MRTRIGAAAVLIIGTAAWALAQREERPRPRGKTELRSVPATHRVDTTVDVALPPTTLATPAEPAGLALPPDPEPSSPADRVEAAPAPPMEPAPLPPPTPAHPDPHASALGLLTRAKAEIERLEGEKRAAEKELARAEARVRAAEGGIARWRSLADTLANALAGLKQGTADRERARQDELEGRSLEPLPAPPPGERATGSAPTPPVGSTDVLVPVESSPAPEEPTLLPAPTP